MKKYDFIKCKECGKPLNKMIYGNLSVNAELPKHSCVAGCCITDYKYECSGCGKRYKLKDVFVTIPGLFKPHTICVKKGFKKGYDTINKEYIQNIIKILEDGQDYKVNEDTEYFEYNDTVLKLFRHINFYEKDYNKNIQKIMNKSIDELKLDETIQYLTYIYRKDRFIEGHIKTYIDNGKLLELLKHLITIC